MISLHPEVATVPQTLAIALFGVGMTELAVIVGILCCLAVPPGIALLVVYLILRNRRES